MSPVPDAVDLSTIRRVLVIKLRHHGDVLLTSPVFQVLRNHAPHLEIDALVYAETRDMLAHHPAVRQVHVIDRAWKREGTMHQLKQEWRLLSALRANRYDLLVHLCTHPRGATLARLLRPRYSVAQRVFRRGRWWRGSFTHMYLLPLERPRHEVEVNLDALRRLGVQPGREERRLVLEPGADANERVRAMMAQYGLRQGGFVLVHPGSRWLFKCWPVEHMVELVANLQRAGERVVLTGAPDPQELAMTRAIAAQVGGDVVDLSGQLTLKQLAALIREADLFIGVDSAPMHIAAAMQTPVIALFGPSGSIEWGPWQVPSRVLFSEHPCRPCGNDGCGGGKVSECLTEISVARVLAARDSLLGAGRTRLETPVR